MERLDGLDDDDGACQDKLQLRDDDVDGQRDGGGVEPVPGCEKDDAGFGGGANGIAKMKWRELLSGRQSPGSVLSLKKTIKKNKKKKMGAKSFSGGGTGRKWKYDSSQHGAMDSFLSRGKGNSLGSS